MNHKVEDFRARRLKNFEENVMPNCRMVGADREQFIKNYHDTTEDLISIQFGSDEIYETEQQEDIVAIDEVKEASEDPMDYVFDTIGDSIQKSTSCGSCWRCLSGSWSCCTTCFDIGMCGSGSGSSSVCSSSSICHGKKYNKNKKVIFFVCF